MAGIYGQEALSGDFYARLVQAGACGGWWRRKEHLVGLGWTLFIFLSCF